MLIELIILLFAPRSPRERGPSAGPRPGPPRGADAAHVRGPHRLHGQQRADDATQLPRGQSARRVAC